MHNIQNGRRLTLVPIPAMGSQEFDGQKTRPLKGARVFLPNAEGGVQ